MHLMNQYRSLLKFHFIYHSFSIAVGAQYVRKHFRQDSKAAALEMVNGIRYQFENILKEVNWMDEETRKSAVAKLHSMSTHIGYPDEIMNKTNIEKYYENLEIDENNYLKSILNMQVFGTNYAFNKLRKPVNKTDWITHARPAIVNAFYSSIENSIQFPAGILQGEILRKKKKYLSLIIWSIILINYIIIIYLYNSRSFLLG